MDGVCCCFFCFLFWGCSPCCALFCGWSAVVLPGLRALRSAVALVVCRSCSVWSGLFCSFLFLCRVVVGLVFCVRFSGLCRVLFLRGVLVLSLLCRVVVVGRGGFRCGVLRWCVVGRVVFVAGGVEGVWCVGGVEFVCRRLKKSFVSFRISKKKVSVSSRGYFPTQSNFKNRVLSAPVTE